MVKPTEFPSPCGEWVGGKAEIRRQKAENLEQSFSISARSLTTRQFTKLPAEHPFHPPAFCLHPWLPFPSPCGEWVGKVALARLEQEINGDPFPSPCGEWVGKGHENIAGYLSTYLISFRPLAGNGLGKLVMQLALLLLVK
jgi:hypothetical protein